MATAWGFADNWAWFRVYTVSPKKLETFLRTNSAGIPYTLLQGLRLLSFQFFGFYYKGFVLRLRSSRSEASPHSASCDTVDQDEVMPLSHQIRQIISNSPVNSKPYKPQKQSRPPPTPPPPPPPPPPQRKKKNSANPQPEAYTLCSLDLRQLIPGSRVSELRCASCATAVSRPWGL